MPAKLVHGDVVGEVGSGLCVRGTISSSAQTAMPGVRYEHPIVFSWDYVWGNRRPLTSCTSSTLSHHLRHPCSAGGRARDSSDGIDHRTRKSKRCTGHRPRIRPGTSLDPLAERAIPEVVAWPINTPFKWAHLGRVRRRRRSRDQRCCKRSSIQHRRFMFLSPTTASCGNHFLGYG